MQGKESGWTPRMVVLEVIGTLTGTILGLVALVIALIALLS